MKKYLAYYENELPANIAELTAVENKPFVGYLKGEGVRYTVIPEPVVGPPDNEIWYTTTDGLKITPYVPYAFNNDRDHIPMISNELVDDKWVMTFENRINRIDGNETYNDSSALFACYVGEKDSYYSHKTVNAVYLPNSISDIGFYAFGGCTNLTDIYYNGTKNEWNNVGKWLNLDAGYPGWGFCFGGVPTNIVHCIDGDAPLYTVE